MARRMLLPCVIVLVVLVTPGRASAHADYESSDPAPCATVPAPASITVEFSEELDPDRFALALTDEGGEVRGSGRLDLDDLERRRAVLDPATPLGTGPYWITWEVRSAIDGDVESGGFGFAVDQSPSSDCALEAGSVAFGAEPGPTGIRWPIIGIGAASLAAGVALVRLVLGRSVSARG